MELEIICKECNGTGEVDGEREVVARHNSKKGKKVKCKYTCLKCYGRGKVLTDLGAAVLKLVKDYAPWESEIEDVRSDIRNIDEKVFPNSRGYD